jgi:hypothetical protein
MVHRQANPHSLVDLIGGRHDDQQVHIAFGIRLAIGIGAEEDDLVRLKPFGDLASQAANGSLRNQAVWPTALSTKQFLDRAGLIHIVVITATPDFLQRRVG